MAAMKMLSRRAQNFREDERGVAMIEMAVVLPVLLAIGLGVIEFGNAIYSKHLITNGVRDGARYAAGLPHDDTTAIANAQCIALTGEKNGDPKCNILNTPVCAPQDCRVSWWKLSTEISVTYTPLADTGSLCGTLASPAFCRGRDQSGYIYVVTVTATAPYQQLGFLAFFGLNAPTLGVSHQERVYGVR